MSIELTGHQYGKAETRVVRVVRDAPRHEIRDLNVTTTMRGDFADAYLTGDQTQVLPTDTQKNTVYAFAKKYGIASPEEFGLQLARHFVHDVAPIHGARIELEEYAWTRASVDGVEHDHTWTRTGSEVRTAAVTVDETGEHVVAGLKDFTILKSTGSEFADFLVDEYTTLVPTHDRVMATSLEARWRYAGVDHDFEGLYPAVKRILIREFATLQSLALQQTLWHMGTAVIRELPEVVEVRLAAPNKHHFVVDLSHFGLGNDNEVFHADDRPYGLIEAEIADTDAAPAPSAWVRSAKGFA